MRQLGRAKLRRIHDKERTVRNKKLSPQNVNHFVYSRYSEALLRTNEKELSSGNTRRFKEWKKKITKVHAITG